jgi:hypothetical protein
MAELTTFGTSIAELNASVSPVASNMSKSDLVEAETPD